MMAISTNAWPRLVGNLLSTATKIGRRSYADSYEVDRGNRHRGSLRIRFRNDDIVTAYWVRPFR